MKRREIRFGPGKILSRFGQEDAKVLAETWLTVFGQQLAPHMHDYMWHVFSYASYPSVAQHEALSAYAGVTSPEYVVLSNDQDEAFLTDQKPSSCSLRDYYVFPKNLAWTMVFTHEDGWLGPYFAKHSDFDKLNDENLRRIRKTEQAAEAKRKGYW